ncbi:hypothetical protein P4S73_29115 [Paraglaciecola sp. Hal342]
MSNTFQSLTLDLAALLNKQITPRSIIGTGYKNPCSVASAWLRKKCITLQTQTVRLAKCMLKPMATPLSQSLKQSAVNRTRL